MKTITFLFLASLLAINNFFSQAPQESPELAQATALTEQVVKLFEEGKYDDALPRAKRALEIREKLLPRTDPRISTSLSNLGEIYLVKRNYKAARELFEQLLQIQTGHHFKRALSIYGRVSGIKDPAFEQASDGLTCLSYESGRQELMTELNEIRIQFAPPREARVDRLDGKALKLPKPKYPVAARDRRLSGIVVVKLEIDEEGKVISATDMCQGPPYLTESALESAREARFTPVTINGQPVKVKGVIKYSFVAQF